MTILLQDTVVPMDKVDCMSVKERGLERIEAGFNKKVSFFPKLPWGMFRFEEDEIDIKLAKGLPKRSDLLEITHDTHPPRHGVSIRIICPSNCETT